MTLMPFQFQQIKFEYDVDVLYPILKPSINTKVDVAAEPKVGLAADKPPLLVIKWFHQTKYNGKIITEYEVEDSYVCVNLVNYESANDEWDATIKLSYNKLKESFSLKVDKLGLGSITPDFPFGNVKLLREKIIEVLKRRL